MRGKEKIRSLREMRGKENIMSLRVRKWITEMWIR